MSEPKLYFLFFMCSSNPYFMDYHHQTIAVFTSSIDSSSESFPWPTNSLHPPRIHGTTLPRTNSVLVPKQGKQIQKKQRCETRSLPIGMQLYWASLHVKSFNHARFNLLTAACCMIEQGSWNYTLNVRTRCSISRKRNAACRTQQGQCHSEW